MGSRGDPRPSSIDRRAQALGSMGRSQDALIGVGSSPCLLFF